MTTDFFFIGNPQDEIFNEIQPIIKNKLLKLIEGQTKIYGNRFPNWPKFIEYDEEKIENSIVIITNEEYDKHTDIIEGNENLLNFSLICLCNSSLIKTIKKNNKKMLPWITYVKFDETDFNWLKIIVSKIELTNALISYELL